MKDVVQVLKEASGEHPTLVCFNTQENFDVVLKNWKNLVELKNFNIYFVNPFSKTDKIWIVFPSTHNLVADEASLELGLRTMFEQVTRTTEEEVRRIIGSS